MERIITSIDLHGRMLIPSFIRERFNIHPGEKVTIEIDNDELKIVNADHLIDDMHEIFMKNHDNKKISIVDDFITKKHQEYIIEETKNRK